MKKPKIVIIGGGTGSFMVLSGLKKYNYDLTAVVSMVDDGGSTGILRDELGALPPGDVRKCLVALSNSTTTMRQLFNFRFRKGSFKGHSFGNLFLTSLEKITGNFKNAVQEVSQILNIKGKVLPVTLDNTRLTIKLDNGKILKGEKYIDSHDFSNSKIEKVYLSNKAKINPDVEEALRESNLIIIAPGTLYGSLIPNFLVSGIYNALKKSKAKIIYICNLVSKPVDNEPFLENYVHELEKYIGGQVIDYVLFNTKKPPRSVISKYKKQKEEIVKIKSSKNHSFKTKKADLISDSFRKTTHSNYLIRHDKKKVTKLILKIYKKEFRRY